MRIARTIFKALATVLRNEYVAALNKKMDFHAVPKAMRDKIFSGSKYLLLAGMIELNKISVRIIIFIFVITDSEAGEQS